MRIGLVSQWYEPEPGPPRLPGVLARGLAANGHPVRVLTGYPNYPTGRLYPGFEMTLRNQTTADGVTVRRVPLYPSHDASPMRRALNYGSFAASATVFGWDYLGNAEALWFYNSPATVALPVLAARRRSGARTVMHLMDLWPDSLYASGFAGADARNGTIGKALERAVSSSYRHVDVIAYISPGMREVLLDRGVPDSKLAYVPLWANEDLFRPTPRDEQLARDLGVENRIVLLYAGALGNVQGLDELVNVCSRMVDLSEFVCVIAGTGVAEDRLRSRAEELGLNNMIFLGPQPQSEMPALMSVGDVHLVSLRTHPMSSVTMPSKIQATLACGRAIVGAVAGDASSVIAASGAGWVSPPGDEEALESTIRGAVNLGRAKLATLGAAGRAYYEQEFSVDVGVGRIESLLAAAKTAEST